MVKTVLNTVGSVMEIMLANVLETVKEPVVDRTGYCVAVGDCIGYFETMLNTVLLIFGTVWETPVDCV